MAQLNIKEIQLKKSDNANGFQRERERESARERERYGCCIRRALLPVCLYIFMYTFT